MSHWSKYEIGECIDLIKESIKPMDLDEDLPYIGLEHIGQGDFMLNSVGISSDIISNKFLFEANDILYGKLRPYFQKVYKPNFKGICSTDIWVLRSKNHSHLDQDFLYHFIRNYYFTIRAVESSTGTRMPRADWEFMKGIKILLPPVKEQQAIAEILSALDDKIELNLEMNKTLEEMAMALYKHWFVDFGPFKDGPFVESELGMIPEGWEVKSLEQMAAIHNKKRQPISSRERAGIQGKYPYYGATSVMDYINDFRFEGRFLLVAEDGTVKTSNNKPYTQFVQGKFWVSNHAHVLTGKNGFSTETLKLAVDNTYVIPFITGAVQPKISKGNLTKMLFPVPAKREVLKIFDYLIFPLFNQVFINKSETQTLTRTRNTLLPKLISGEVRVKDAEKIVGELT